MTEYSRYNVVYRLQKWLDSVPGQTFLNYAYSWGASIVILGTLFKLTHLPGANIMLYLGMGTEVIVFFISAFDRPFDKTAIGKDIPTHVGEEEEDELPLAEDESDAPDGESIDTPAVQMPGGTVVAGGIMPGLNGENGEAVAAAGVAQGMPWIAAQQQQAPEMEEATSNYVDELNRLTETLAKVSEQSARLTQGSEEMENLNRTLTGICKVYEMQLKSASSQIGTIDEINEQSRKMAAQIEQLNGIYARMIEAMTVNMRAAAPIKD